MSDKSDHRSGPDRIGNGPIGRRRVAIGTSLEEVGFSQVLRDLHRAFARALQERIVPHGVSMGQWFFLRALWEEDGLTQRELSQRVGMMEPTTVTALNSMERRGLVERCRNTQDRRKVNIYLTPKGKALRDVLQPMAAEVERVAISQIPLELLPMLRGALVQMIDSLDANNPGHNPFGDLDLD